MHENTDTRRAAAHWDIPVGILIPHADVADIWDTATVVCGYWAADMQGAHGDPGAYYVRERVTAGAAHDYAFTGRDIATAVARIIAGRIPVAPSIRQDITDGDYDGDAADVIIQVAAFGEIVYG